MNKNILLKTKRLIISPMTDEEIELLISNCKDSVLAIAYTEMLDGCRNDPENRVWYAPWKLCLKNNPDTEIGNICFKGPQKKGAVEIGYGINKEYQGNGYMTEAVKQLISWAFTQTDVYIINAETEPENFASKRILEKLSFKQCKGEQAFGEEGPRYYLEKSASSWMSIYMMFGMSIGTSLGLAFEHMSIGMSLGIFIGLLIGLALDNNEKKHRIEVTGEDSNQKDNISNKNSK